jgi:MFS family permease
MYLSDFLFGLMFFAPIWALYVQQNLFTVQNVAVIISIQAIAGVIFELPTGAIGDLFGRRKTIVVGSFLFLFSVVVLYFANTLYLFVIYAFLSALGSSLINGTNSALIYDTLKEENKEQYYKKVNGTLQALWPLGATIASIFGGYLAQTSLSLSVLITLIPFSISFSLLLFLKEPKYKKSEHKNFTRVMDESGEKHSFLVQHSPSHKQNDSSLIIVDGTWKQIFSVSAMDADFPDVPGGAGAGGHLCAL